MKAIAAHFRYISKNGRLDIEDERGETMRGKDEPHRAMRDVGLLGFGDAAEDALLATFREIMTIEVDDGVSFDLKGLRIDPGFNGAWVVSRVRGVGPCRGRGQAGRGAVRK